MIRNLDTVDQLPLQIYNPVPVNLYYVTHIFSYAEELIFFKYILQYLYTLQKDTLCVRMSSLGITNESPNIIDVCVRHKKFCFVYTQLLPALMYSTATPIPNSIISLPPSYLTICYMCAYTSNIGIALELFQLYAALRIYVFQCCLDVSVLGMVVAQVERTCPTTSSLLPDKQTSLDVYFMYFIF